METVSIPQTGQVYFNLRKKRIMGTLIGLNPLKRVKFISCYSLMKMKAPLSKSQSPQTGQVYFNHGSNKMLPHRRVCLNPSNGQVYFMEQLNYRMRDGIFVSIPSTGQVYFNRCISDEEIKFLERVSIPQTGQLFQ